MSSRLGEVAAAWASSRWVEVRGRQVRYREAGSGLPLVLVHGLGVSADYWVRNAAVLAAAGFRVLAPDLPGFGRTEGPADGLDVPAQVAAVREWAAAVGVGPAVYLGHSLSCQTILQLAVDDPPSVRGLILAAPTGEGAVARRLIRQAIGLVLDVPRESLKLSMLVASAYMRAGPMKVFRTWRMGARHDPMPLLDQVDCRGVVIVGDRDPVVELTFAREMAKGMRNGRVLVVPGGSHAVIFDRTGAFNAAVLEFLGEVERAGRSSEATPSSEIPRSPEPPPSS